MPHSFDPSRTAPLKGVRVLDLSRLVCGNMLSLQLADFGADTVKIEDPGKGDPLRDWRVDGISIHWKVYGRNKRSLALDLRADGGKEALLRLVDSAHVFVESFKPGTLEKIGLGPERLLERNPRLVILRVSGFGQTGPYSTRPGFGTLVEAMSGFAAKTGYADRAPVLPATALADMIAGLQGAFAVMVALRHAEATGQGQVIDLSLLEPILSVCGPDPAVYALAGRKPQRTGSRSTTTAPRNVYRTKDGRFVAMSASMQSMAERVFRTIGRPELMEDPRFRTNTDRVANIEVVDGVVQEWMERHDQAEILEIMERAGVTVGPVYEVDQLIEDPHVKEREVLVGMEDEDAGSVLMHNIIPRLSKSPGAFRLPSPRIGEHSLAVLREAGFEEDEIEALLAGGAIAGEKAA
ncbi:CaiB/BaiF CoA transferase family protein [Marinimicrococcus flavescens]|uniref:CaiB/BaiF CoA-transferase family protein n=1 Tax=Marinimicrococcus flavescens TaxID=3031815 RepID=A0AAP3UZ78_9PROT|nr:CaiB/BaiF CoA-transferase family protein [Marinimicrococcus flavescens]